MKLSSLYCLLTTKNLVTSMQKRITRSLLLTLPAATMAFQASVAIAEDNKYLDLDLNQLMAVTITSVAKKPQKLADTAAAVFVITQDDIRKSGVTSIPDILAMAPGLQVSRISASRL